MKTIAIVNQKGGSGKTTATALIVKALADSGKNVLALDADPQGGLTSILSSEEFPHVDKTGIFEILMGKKPEFGDTIQETQRDLFQGKIDLIASDYRLDKVFLSASPFVLKFISSLQYDFVVIDTPPTVQGITRAAICAVDSVLIPTEISVQAKGPTAYTIKEVIELEKTPRVIFSGWKDPGEKGGFQANLSRDFQNEFGQYVVGNIPRNSTAVSFASEWKKSTPSTKAGIIKTLQEIIEKV